MALLVVLVAAGPLTGRLAMPALAALLILTAWNMSEPHRWRGYLTERRSDQFLMGLTLVLTVLADLTVAIAVGVALGLALRLWRRGVPPADWDPPRR
jgi:SulP family sulfate permease